MEKYCRNCKGYKKFTDFHKHKKGQFGLYPICKSCRKSKPIINSLTISNKECKTCNKKFSIDNFYKNRCNKDGFQNNCKECYLEKRSISKSKLSSYLKILLHKFKNKNKLKINFNELDLENLYNCQNKKCFITNHRMTHYVDTKGRIDNIYNISIIRINEKKELKIKDIKLAINLFYSVGLQYNMDSTNILNLYKELTCKNCSFC